MSSRKKINFVKKFKTMKIRFQIKFYLLSLLRKIEKTGIMIYIDRVDYFEI